MKWSDLLNLFEFAHATFGQIDIVVANAGIGRSETIWEDSFDEDGRLKEPNHRVIQINLIAVLNSRWAGSCYIR